jgi:hypothetical protein
VSGVATADAVEQSFRIAVPADSVADWYRRELVRNMLKRVLSHVGQL